MTEKQKQQPVSYPTGQGFEAPSEKKIVPQEQLQREADYARAQRMLESMLDKGLISLSEFNRITALNRESFSPMLAEIMP